MAPLKMISMKERLQPKQHCQANLRSPVSSTLPSSAQARIGVMPVKGLLPLDVLTRDLECSSTSSEDLSDLEENAPNPLRPLMDPNEVVSLDGMKLRINLRLIKKEEAKLKARPRKNSESSLTSCSMEEEDLPLYDDILSEVSLDSSSCSSPAAKRQKNSSLDYITDESLNGDKKEDEVKWLPYREPSPDNQEDYVKREVQGMREYDS